MSRRPTVFAEHRPSRFARVRRLLRAYFACPSGSPPVSGSTSSLRSCSIVGSFFYRRTSPTRTPHATIVRIIFQFVVQIASSLTDRFRIKLRQFGDLFCAAVSQHFREQPANPSSLLLIKSRKDQRNMSCPVLPRRCHCRCRHKRSLHGSAELVQPRRMYNQILQFRK